MKKTVLLNLLIVLLYPAFIQSQTEQKVINQTNSCRLLHVRPNMVIGISPTDGEFLVQLNIDAQYWYKEKMDFRFSALSGTLTGLSVGATYHLKDRFVSKPTKFIVSETESGGKRYTEYYRKNADIRKVFGPTGDLKYAYVNFEKNNTAFPFIELRGGVDFQYFSRNYMDYNSETYPSNKNGWFSVKGLGAIQYFKIGTDNAIQFGALGSMNAVKRPWKGVSMNLNMDLGATFGSEGVLPIINIGFGISINLINSKKTIEY